MSKYISSNLMFGYFSATSRVHLRKSPSDRRIMFALCTTVTFSRLFAVAYSKANSATRREACSVISLILWTTPGTICFFVVNLFFIKNYYVLYICNQNFNDWKTIYARIRLFLYVPKKNISWDQRIFLIYFQYF